MQLEVYKVTCDGDKSDALCSNFSQKFYQQTLTMEEILRDKVMRSQEGHASGHSFSNSAAGKMA